MDTNSSKIAAIRVQALKDRRRAERMAPPCDSDLYRHYDADTGLIVVDDDCRRTVASRQQFGGRTVGGATLDADLAHQFRTDREFGRQLLSFLIFIGAGSVALFASLASLASIKRTSASKLARLPPDVARSVPVTTP